MQTHFSLAQLADPDLAEADRILRACVHCGFCLSTCPTYVLTGDERDSPRGRIYLVKAMLEAEQAPDPVTAHHLDRCLNCLSCMSTCPSGVDYNHLAELARLRLAADDPRPWRQKWQRRVLAWVLPRPALFRAGLFTARLGFGLGLGFLMPGRWRDLIGSIIAWRRRSRHRDEEAAPRRDRNRRRVILIGNCVQSVLRPEIDAAALRLLARQNIETHRVQSEGCCGALSLHLGEAAAAMAFARRTIEACEGLLAEGPIEAILVTASGCGSVIKDYGHLFRADPHWQARAAKIAGLARDISEYLAMLASAMTVSADPARSGLRVAYHAACSLRHGQKIDRAPVDLLRQAGFSVFPIAESHLCCGSAGTYNLLQPDLADRLKARKLARIAEVQPDLVTAGNIGCLEHLASGGRLPFLHVVELLDWATGGVRPSHLPISGEGGG